MNTKRRPPIGSIAVQKGFVTNEQVEYALSLQRQKKATENKNIRLGDLLSELGFIDSKQFLRDSITPFVAAQRLNEYLQAKLLNKI